MKTAVDLETLPGGTLVREGLADWVAGRRTVAGTLVQIAKHRLTRAGLVQPDLAASVPAAELELYRLLRMDGGDAFSRYNSLVRELISFENALDRVNSSRARDENALKSGGLPAQV